MSILIKLIVWVIGAMIAFQAIIVLIPISLILTGIAALVCAIGNAAICGIKDGNGASAWQGACNGAGVGVSDRYQHSKNHCKTDFFIR